LQGSVLHLEFGSCTDFRPLRFAVFQSHASPLFRTVLLANVTYVSTRTRPTVYSPRFALSAHWDHGGGEVVVAAAFGGAAGLCTYDLQLSMLLSRREGAASSSGSLAVIIENVLREDACLERF